MRQLKIKRMDRRPLLLLCALVLCLLGQGATFGQVLGDPIDVSHDFQKPENIYFIGSRVAAFDPVSGNGSLVWDRYLRNTTLSFNKIDVGFAKGKATEFPGTEYDENPSLPFSISFVDQRTIRLRFNSRNVSFDHGQSLMLDSVPKNDPELEGRANRKNDHVYKRVRPGANHQGPVAHRVL
jgi:alpha-D-xyloside xylohydrolase